MAVARVLTGLSTYSGAPVLLARPEARWGMLLQADWPTFFKNSPKTFRELRWWYCLLATNSRVYLLHAISFAICIVVAWPTRWQVG